MDMPVAKELISVEDVPNYDDLDILIIGERNMANYPLLAAAAESGKTIILKRSVSATLEEFLMCAEYIMAGGNTDIILCDRGLRTFANETKATFDISAIPLLKSGYYEVFKRFCSHRRNPPPHFAGTGLPDGRHPSSVR